MAVRTSARRLVTADDLLRMPDNGWHHEVVRGRLIKMPLPKPRHGRLSYRLTMAIGQHVEEHRLGMVFPQDTGFKLTSDPDTVLGPDLAFVSKERIPTTPDWDKFWDVAPDLAVEVLSPSDRPGRTGEKVRDWIRYGAREVWVVAPRTQTVTIHRADGTEVTLGRQDALEGGDVLPGFTYPLSRLFEGFPETSRRRA